MSETLAAQPTAATFLTLDNGDEVRINKWGATEQSEHITVQGEVAEEEQGSFSSIPVIDISRIYSSNLDDRKALAEEIRHAAHVVGFFYASHHGIDDKFIDGVNAQAKRFFALPDEQKMDVWTKKVQGAMVGYHPPLSYNRENRAHKEWHEAYIARASSSARQRTVRPAASGRICGRTTCPVSKRGCWRIMRR